MSGTDPVFYVLVQPAGAKEAARVDASDLITALEYEDSEKKVDKLTLTVDNWDLSNFDNPIWKPGTKLFVRWGYAGRMAPARECIIQKVTGGTTLKVEAQGKALLMNAKSRDALYENTRRSEIVHSLAKEYGYGDDVRFIEETFEEYEHISQARATDAQFIKRLADAEGFEFYIDHTGFHWHARQMGQAPQRVLQWFLPPHVGDIIDFNVENDIFAKPAKVVAKGRDPLGKKTVTGEGSDSATERTTLGVPEAKEPGLGDALNTLLGAKETKPEAPPPDESPGWHEKIDEASGEETVEFEEQKPTTEKSDSQAKKEAGAGFKRAAQTTVKLTVNMVGDPFIFAKTVLDIRGISKRLSGLYYVNEVKHTIDSGGYKLGVKCATDSTGGRGAGSNVLELEREKGKKKAAASKAAVNDKKPAEDPAALVEVVDARSGETTYLPGNDPRLTSTQKPK